MKYFHFDFIRLVNLIVCGASLFPFVSGWSVFHTEYFGSDDDQPVGEGFASYMHRYRYLSLMLEFGETRGTLRWSDQSASLLTTGNDTAAVTELPETTVRSFDFRINNVWNVSGGLETVTSFGGDPQATRGGEKHLILRVHFLPELFINKEDSVVRIEMLQRKAENEGEPAAQPEPWLFELELEPMVHCFRQLGFFHVCKPRFRLRNYAIVAGFSVSRADGDGGDTKEVRSKRWSPDLTAQPLINKRPYGGDFGFNPQDLEMNTRNTSGFQCVEMTLYMGPRDCASFVTFKGVYAAAFLSAEPMKPFDHLPLLMRYTECSANGRSSVVHRAMRSLTNWLLWHFATVCLIVVFSFVALALLLRRLSYRAWQRSGVRNLSYVTTTAPFTLDDFDDVDTAPIYQKTKSPSLSGSSTKLKKQKFTSGIY